MRAEDIPQDLVDLLDAGAGKRHRRNGPVLTNLATILTRYDQIRAVNTRPTGPVEDTMGAPQFHPHARVIADSISPEGNRLTTIEVTLHRFVLAQLNTHRALSRNAASNRAIPVRRVITAVRERTAYPVSWPDEKTGMVGGDELPEHLRHTAIQVWDAARDHALTAAEHLHRLGVHKSIVNRLLEPFQTTTVIVSATEWDNFFAQRASEHAGAQPELYAAAVAMREARDASIPQKLRIGRWHLPYVQVDEMSEHPYHLLRTVSAARCARVSYLTHDGQPSISADVALFHKLVGATPPHASPLEHVATPAVPGRAVPGNFTGWYQLRHLVLGEDQ